LWREHIQNVVQPRPANKQERDPKQPSPTHLDSHNAGMPQHPAHLIYKGLGASHLFCSTRRDHLTTIAIT
jgi:hypothetical protein